MFSLLKALVYPAAATDSADGTLIFLGRTAVFARSFTTQFYQRLWVQNGGEILYVPSVLDNEGPGPTIDGGRDIDSATLQAWDLMVEKADYVFVDSRTWANLTAVDARIVPFDPKWIADCVRAKTIVPATRHAFWPRKINSYYDPPKRHLQQRRTPLAVRVGLSADDIGSIQICLQRLRASARLNTTPNQGLQNERQDSSSPCLAKRQWSHSSSPARAALRKKIRKRKSKATHADDPIASVIRPTRLRQRFVAVQEKGSTTCPPPLTTERLPRIKATPSNLLGPDSDTIVVDSPRFPLQPRPLLLLDA